MWTNRHLFPHSHNCSENLMLVVFICKCEIYRNLSRSGGVLCCHEMSIEEPVLHFPGLLCKILPDPSFQGPPQKGLALCSEGTKGNFKAEGHAHTKNKDLHCLSLLLQTGGWTDLNCHSREIHQILTGKHHASLGMSSLPDECAKGPQPRQQFMALIWAQLLM